MKPRVVVLLALVSVVLATFFYQASSSEEPVPDAPSARPSADLASIIRAYQKPQAEWPAPHLSENVSHRPLAPLPEVTYPEENPYSARKAYLGKLLFFDPRISSSGSLACASCHDPDLGWSDGRQRSFGHARREGKRNSLSILNVAFYDHLFWDGRAKTLEAQAMAALAGPAEMNRDADVVPDRIEDVAAYQQLFEDSFGTPEITARRVTQALATFERGITSRTSDFDRFLEGDRGVLTDRQIRGLHLFRTKARCMNCHNGALLSDNRFHNLGQSHLGRPSEDLGRFRVTGDTSDVGSFRTPSLRDVTYTGPYLHHGLIFSLREVIDMYERGMPQVIPKKERDNPLYPTKSPLLEPVNLTEDEKDALLAFLESLSTRPRRVSAPDLPGLSSPL